MTKFTIEQRHEIYKTSLEYYKFKLSKGLYFSIFGCIFDIVYNIHYHKDWEKCIDLFCLPDNKIKLEFPELYDNCHIDKEKTQDIINTFEKAIKDSDTFLDLSM